MQDKIEQTSIRVSKRLLGVLQSMKTHPKDSYEEIIWEAIEPYLDLNEKTKRNIEKSKEEFENDEYYTLDELEEKYGK